MYFEIIKHTQDEFFQRNEARIFLEINNKKNLRKMEGVNFADPFFVFYIPLNYTLF